MTTSLFGTTNLVKNADKNKYLYSGFGIELDGAYFRDFGNDFVRNVKVFRVDNSSSSHSDNFKNNFLVIGEGPSDDFNGSVCTAEQKNLVLNSLKQIQKFPLVWIIMVIPIIYLLMG